MTSACKSPTCAAGFDRVEFAYDGEGHRTQTKTTSAAGAVAVRDFRYQGSAIVEEQLTDAAHPAGAVVRSYISDDAGSAVKLIIPAGEPDAGTYLVTWNGHGDALALWRQNSDGTLTLANSYTYTTWGRPTTTTHNGSADLGFRFLYVGEFDVQWDDAFGLGLAYMHARHYSPTLGRFLQPDPDGSEANLYAYTANNPVTELDPSGTCFILCAVLNAAIDTAIYLATTDNATLEGAAGAAAVGAVSGFLGVGLLSKVTKIGTVAKALTKVPKAGRVANRTATSCARHSFDGAILVSRADGSQVPISELRVGERVLAWDEASGQSAAYPVSATWVHDDLVTGVVVIAGEAIATTPGHPFYVIDRGWVEAADLVRGDRVPSVNGDAGVVETVRWDRGPDTMYDLTVAIAHTYVVGAGGWRVHNCDDLVKAAEKAYPKKVGRDEWHHIQPRYLEGARNSPQVRIPAPYHQLITNKFRQLAPYGRPKPDATRARQIMRDVYEEFPIRGFDRR